MRNRLGFGVLFVAVAQTSAGQSFVVNLPLKSQRAEVEQTIGITDIRIAYHRPLVNGRVIWDSLVPYGKVWRNGANINTTISFSDPVRIEGQAIDAGTYGVHMIPGAETWTIIFSKNATSWGSFTYNPNEAALRLSVTPRPAPMHEALTYEFDDIQPGSTVVELLWERLVVPFRVDVDVHAIVLANLRQQLRAFPRYTWMSWNDAASYLLAEKIALDTALAYADTSIANEDRYDNEMTKANVLLAMGRRADGLVAERKALELGTPVQVDQFAREALAQKRNDEAYDAFRLNGTKHADAWFVHDGLARVYSAEHRFGDAQKEMRVARDRAPEKEKSRIEGLVKRLDARQDINTGQ
jgi:Protein of unknown function (DUF2911)